MIDFPNSPTVGQVHTATNGAQWKWDGTTWLLFVMPGSAMVAKSGDTMTGPLVVQGAQVGKIFDGGYDGVQALPVGSSGGSGGALLLGHASDSGAYMMSKGDFNIRPALDYNAQWTWTTTQALAKTPLAMSADPTAPMQVATKQYVDGKATTLPTRLAPGTQLGGITITDWNNALESGWYDGSGAANAPIPGEWLSGEVVVHRGTTDRYLTQTVWKMTDSGLAGRTYQWRRQCQSSVWTAWALWDADIDRQIAANEVIRSADGSSNISTGNNWGQIPGSPGLNTTWTKIKSDSLMQFTLHVSFYTSIAGALKFGLYRAGTNHVLMSSYVQAASTHEGRSGTMVVSGIPAGTYTVYPVVWFPTGSYINDANDQTSYHIREIRGAT